MNHLCGQQLWDSFNRVLCEYLQIQQSQVSTVQFHLPLMQRPSKTSKFFYHLTCIDNSVVEPPPQFNMPRTLEGSSSHLLGETPLLFRKVKTTRKRSKPKDGEGWTIHDLKTLTRTSENNPRLWSSHHPKTYGRKLFCLFFMFQTFFFVWVPSCAMGYDLKVLNETCFNRQPDQIAASPCRVAWQSMAVFSFTSLGVSNLGSM